MVSFYRGEKNMNFGIFVFEIGIFREIPWKFPRNFPKIHNSNHVATCHWLVVCHASNFLPKNNLKTPPFFSMECEQIVHMMNIDTFCHLVNTFLSPMGSNFFLFNLKFQIFMTKLITNGIALSVI